MKTGLKFGAIGAGVAVVVTSVVGALCLALGNEVGGFESLLLLSGFIFKSAFRLKVDSNNWGTIIGLSVVVNAAGGFLLGVIGSRLLGILRKQMRKSDSGPERKQIEEDDARNADFTRQLVVLVAFIPASLVAVVIVWLVLLTFDGNAVTGIIGLTSLSLVTAFPIIVFLKSKAKDFLFWLTVFDVVLSLILHFAVFLGFSDFPGRSH